MIPVLCTAAVLIAVTTGLSVRVVPSGECLVVLRGRSARRVAGPGVTALVPFRDRGARVPLESQEVPLVIRTVTRDSGEIVVLATLAYRVSDPARAAVAAAVGVTTGVLTEELAAVAFAGLTVDRVGSCPEEVLRGVVAAVNVRSALWGVTVESLRIDEVDLRLVAP